MLWSQQLSLEQNWCCTPWARLQCDSGTAAEHKVHTVLPQQTTLTAHTPHYQIKPKALLAGFKYCSFTRYPASAQNTEGTSSSMRAAFSSLWPFAELLRLAKRLSAGSATYVLKKKTLISLKTNCKNTWNSCIFFFKCTSMIFCLCNISFKTITCKVCNQVCSQQHKQQRPGCRCPQPSSQPCPEPAQNPSPALETWGANFHRLGASPQAEHSWSSPALQLSTVPTSIGYHLSTSTNNNTTRHSSAWCIFLIISPPTIQKHTCTFCTDVFKTCCHILRKWFTDL